MNKRNKTWLLPLRKSQSDGGKRYLTIISIMVNRVIERSVEEGCLIPSAGQKEKTVMQFPGEVDA